VAKKLTLELDDLVVELLSKLNRFESVNDFDSNVVDPFAAAIEAAVFGHENESEWRISELHRQKQKALMNQIGNLQQAIIGRLPGWKSFDAGFDMPDVVGSRGGQKIIAEVKNKYNTMNSNSAAETYDKLVDFLTRDEFKGYIGVVVQIVGPLPRGVNWKPFAPGKKRVERNDLIVMGGRPFYAIATDEHERQPVKDFKSNEPLNEWNSWHAIDQMTTQMFSSISRCVGSEVPPWVHKFLSPAIGS
jgi:hypothetical protein